MNPSLQIVLDEVASRWKPDSAEARRLFHGRGHSFPGWEHLVINWLPPVLQIAAYQPVDEQLKIELKNALLELASGTFGHSLNGMVLQHRQGRGTRTEVLHGEVAEELVVQEAGLKFLVKPLENQNVGLFMDMAHVRAWLAPRVADKRVLNLFAYTCAFSVSAMHHGARRVVNNDMSRNALDWGKRNHALNGTDMRDVRMVPHNLFKSWWKLRQLGPYDIIIIDPPTNQRGSFVAEKSYGQVLKRLPELAASGATVLACLNSPFLTADFLEAQMARWCDRARLVEQLPLHPDFPDQFPERGLKVLAFEYQ